MDHVESRQSPAAGGARRGHIVFAAAGATALALAGCASVTVQHQQEELALRPDCCTGFEQMRFDALAPAAARTVELDTTSPVHAFAGGKAYFAAFTLPAAPQRARRLRLKTDVHGGFFGDTVFCPALSFLDGEGQVLQTGVVQMQFMRTSFLGSPIFVASVAPPEGATRVVVHSAPAGTKARFDTYGGGFAYMAGPTVVVAPARPMTQAMACTAIGTLELAVD